MGRLQHQLRIRDGQFVIAANDMPISKLIERLEQGEPPVELLGSAGLEPADLIAAIAADPLGDDAAAGPTLEQSVPTRLRLCSALSEPAWAEVFPRGAKESRLCLSAGLLQIHDFWDLSHDAAQVAEDLGERTLSAYWHGIAHRREPDPGNATYWFRRVGHHPVFVPLAIAARAILDEEGDTVLTGKILPASGWNSSAMIDLCSGAGDRRGGSLEQVARQLQRAEMWLLLDATIDVLL